jgi:hypothetical protein
LSRPRTLSCVSPPTVLLQPKHSSMRLRSRWLIA